MKQEVLHLQVVICIFRQVYSFTNFSVFAGGGTDGIQRMVNLISVILE